MTAHHLDAVDNPNSFDRVPTYWLPTIRALGVNVPVVLIGNKIDLREGQVTNQALEDGEWAVGPPIGGGRAISARGLT